MNDAGHDTDLGGQLPESVPNYSGPDFLPPSGSPQPVSPGLSNPQFSPIPDVTHDAGTPGTPPRPPDNRYPTSGPHPAPHRLPSVGIVIIFVVVAALIIGIIAASQSSPQTEPVISPSRTPTSSTPKPAPIPCSAPTPTDAPPWPPASWPTGQAAPIAQPTFPTGPVTPAQLPAPPGTLLFIGLNIDGLRGTGTIDSDQSAVTAVPGLTGVTKVLTGNGNLTSAYALTSEGTVWAWGYNNCGQLGLDNMTDTATPQPVKQLSGISDIAAGLGNAVAVTADGQVWEWGKNVPDTDHRIFISTLTPVKISGLPPIRHISGGENGYFAVDTNGQVWTWGADASMGSLPAAISGLTHVTMVSTNGATVLALLANGTVRAWGRGSRGEIGNDSRLDQTTPVQVTGLSNIQSIAQGESTSYALSSDGSVWCWGLNMFGQCGTGAEQESPSSFENIYLSPVQIPGLTGVTRLQASSQMGFAWTANELLTWGNGEVMRLVPNVSQFDPFPGVPVPSAVAGLPGITQIYTVTTGAFFISG